MSGAHVIETLEFDVAFGTEADAWARHERMGDFAAGRALAVIAEVFDEFDETASVMRLDCLEVDLGVAPADESEADAEARLRSGLRRALRELIPSGEPAAATAPAIQVAPAGAADLERLWSLIHLGRLPWQAGPMGHDDLRALVARVLERDGEAIAQALREARDMPRLIARIARQWSPDQLERLRRLLAPAASGGPPETLLAPEGPAEAARAWERALVLAIAGPEADPEALAWQAARTAFSAAIREGRMSPAAWGAILRREPDFARAELRRLGSDAAAPGRLAQTLTPGQWRDLLALTVEAADRETLLALTADPWPWRHDERLPLEAVSLALRTALFTHVIAERSARVAARDAIAALVRALADLEARAVADTATTLAARWPREGPAGAQRVHLIPVLTDLAGTAGERAPDARDPWPRDLAARLDRGDLDDDAWAALFEGTPEWLGQRFRSLGRRAAWRDTFAAGLSPLRLLQILTLWLPADEARLLSAMAGRMEVRGDAQAGPEGLPRRWLLDEVLLARGDRPDVARVVESMVRRQARQEGRTPAEAAQVLVASWPASPSRIAERVLARLGALEPRGRDPWFDPETDARGAAGRGDMDPDRWRDDLDDAAWDAQPSENRRSLVARLVRLGAAPDWTALGPARLSQVLSLWMPDDDAAFLAALASPAAAGQLGDGGPSGQAAAPIQQWILEALLALPHDAPTVAGVVEALVQRAAQRDGRTFAAVAAALAASWAGEGPAAAVGGRLRAILASPGFGRGGAGGPDAESGEHGAVQSGEAPAGAREADDRPAESGFASGAAGLLSAAGLARLPRRLSPAQRVALEAELLPPGTGVARLAGLSEAQRRDLLQRLRPRDAPPALEILDRLVLAWRRLEAADPAPAPAPPGARNELAWTLLLREFIEEDRLFEAAGFAGRWFDAMTAGGDAGVVRGWRAALAATLDMPEVLSPAGGSFDALADAVEEVSEPAAWTAAPWPGLAQPEPVPGEALYVANAGMVLAGPYAPLLFERLELTRDGAFTDDACAERAVHLLQFMVDGAGPAPEHELVLNKLLCGLDLTAPIGREFEIASHEREVIEGLLEAMIERWRVIGSTSVAGLRESFLQRRGVLRDEIEAWRLTVEPRAFDMLLDQIPWGFKTLKLPWMAQVLHVDWR